MQQVGLLADVLCQELITGAHRRHAPIHLENHICSGKRYAELSKDLRDVNHIT
jgi:hypothetical protein